MMMKQLTPEQMDVVHWLCQGKTGIEIKIILGVSDRAIRRRLERIREATGTTNMHGIVATAFRSGWVQAKAQQQEGGE